MLFCDNQVKAKEEMRVKGTALMQAAADECSKGELYVSMKISVNFQIYNSFVNPLHDINMHKTVLV